MGKSQVQKAFPSAVVAIVGVLVAFGVEYSLCTKLSAGPAPAILATALSVGLMRRAEPLEARSLLGKLILLPLLALVLGPSVTS